MIVKIGTDTAVNSDKIKCILTMSSNASRALYRNASEENRLLNLTKGKPCKTIFLIDDGSIIASNMRIDTILKRINCQDT